MHRIPEPPAASEGLKQNRRAPMSVFQHDDNNRNNRNNDDNNTRVGSSDDTHARARAQNVKRHARPIVSPVLPTSNFRLNRIRTYVYGGARHCGARETAARTRTRSVVRVVRSAVDPRAAASDTHVSH